MTYIYIYIYIYISLGFKRLIGLNRFVGHLLMLGYWNIGGCNKERLGLNVGTYFCIRQLEEMRNRCDIGLRRMLVKRVLRMAGVWDRQRITPKKKVIYMIIQNNADSIYTACFTFKGTLLFLIILWNIYYKGKRRSYDSG